MQTCGYMGGQRKYGNFDQITFIKIRLIKNVFMSRRLKIIGAQEKNISDHFMV